MLLIPISEANKTVRTKRKITPLQKEKTNHITNCHPILQIYRPKVLRKTEKLSNVLEVVDKVN